MRMKSLVMSLSVLALVACDASGGGGGGGAMPTGAQACGTTFEGAPVVCKAGQYCQDQNLAICESGCLSDDNCASNQTCVKTSGANVGACQNVSSPEPDVTSTPDQGPGPTDTPCRSACDEARTCGFLSATEVAACKQGCDFDAQLAQAIADCVDAAGCSAELPECFGADCGGSYGCPAGQSCEDGFCE